MTIPDDPHRAAGGGRDDDRPKEGRWADRGVVQAADAKTVWVLVADEAVARFLLWNGDVGELENLETLTDAAAHANEGDFDRDAAGRRTPGHNVGARQGGTHHASSPSSVTASAADAEGHLEAKDFARRVAQHLTEAWRSRRFDELRIAAAPRFLGHLRKELDAKVSASVSEELNKDLIHISNDELARRLFPAPPGA
jgi:protein required for attachment to host cells